VPSWLWITRNEAPASSIFKVAVFEHLSLRNFDALILAKFRKGSYMHLKRSGFLDVFLRNFVLSGSYRPSEKHPGHSKEIE
jgi:hypothetical protein